MKKTILADSILLGVTFVWGATFVLVKEAINTMPPFTFLAVRFLFAALLLFLFMLFFARDALRGIDRRLWFSGAALGLWLFAGYAFQTFGLEFTTSSKAGFITGLSVVFVPFLALWMLRQKLKRNALLGSGVATVGLALLSLTRDLSVNIGDLLVLLCAISYALQIVLVGRYAPRYHAFTLALLQIFFCGVFNLIGSLLFEDISVVFSPDVLFDPWVLWALLICSVLATAVAFVAQNQFQKFTTPTRTALIFSTEPVFAALTAFFWAGERLDLQQVVGCLLILAGTLFAELGGHDDKPQSEPVPSSS
ncbi:DMT family transporter [Tumebacillus flagellatus]|uniref:Membrane protein n=1 Tax=Tumebacillus flagellatus TaxID=1157490 RepID=A0A074M5A8_9BACL|nr:DMT family transporter [Tumebacillus flagellatus]KEO81157.1 membrane protein [Tumebacillus flagellatus]